MEIERKFLLSTLPKKAASAPFQIIEQAYLCTEPVVRIRRQDQEYLLTYKSAGMMSREEANLPLTEEAYRHLLPKADGTIITKKRYLLPLTEGLTAELDEFHGALQGLLLAEVEFADEETAKAFMPPFWFGPDVTFDKRFHNNYLSRLSAADAADFLGILTDLLDK